MNICVPTSGFRNKINCLLLILAVGFISYCKVTKENSKTPVYIRSITIEGSHIYAISGNRLFDIDQKSGEIRQFKSEYFYQSYSISAGPDGEKYISTDKGIYAFVDEKWIEIPGFPGHHAEDIVLNKKNNKELWLTGYNIGYDILGHMISKPVGPIKFDGQKFTLYDPIPPTDRKISIVFDRSGNLWYSNGKRLAKYDGEKWEIFDSSNSDLAEIEYICSLGSDILGNIWIGGCEADEIIKFNGLGTKIYQKSKLNISPEEQRRVDHILSDNSGNIWFSFCNAWDCLIGKFDGSNRWVIYKEENFRFYIDDLAIDDDGNIWIGGGGDYFGGLIKYDGEKWTHYEISVSSGQIDKYLYEVKPYQMKYYEINQEN